MAIEVCSFSTSTETDERSQTEFFSSYCENLSHPLLRWRYICHFDALSWEIFKGLDDLFDYEINKLPEEDCPEQELYKDGTLDLIYWPKPKGWTYYDDKLLDWLELDVNGVIEDVVDE